MVEFIVALLKNRTCDPSHQLEYIDGLRGLAILAVLANHWHFYGFGRSKEISELSWHFFIAGHTGVLLFFMVSALTLFRSLTRRKDVERKFLRNFYIRRFFRIFPLWWFAIYVCAQLKGESVSEYGIHFPMLFGFQFFPKKVFSGEWTLFIEETFYLLLPLFFFRIKTLRASILLLVSCLALRILWVAITIDHLGMPRGFVSLSPPTHYYVFAIGICFFFLPLQKIRLTPTSGWIISFLLMVAIISHAGSHQWLDGDHWNTLLISGIFLLAVDRKTPIGWLVRTDWLKAFGVCCYSIYLLHVPIAVILRRNIALREILPPEIPLEVTILGTLPLFCAICLAVGIFFYRFFELPCIWLGARIIQMLSQFKRLSPRRV